MKKIGLLFILSIMLIGFTNNLHAQLNLLSGVEGGTYQALAEDIQRASSQKITVINSKGSVENFERLVEDNDIFVAFVQYDVLISNEEKSPVLRKDLRVLLPLFLDEEVHLIAKSGSGIANVQDLAGKKVAVGIHGQGTFVTAATIKKFAHVQWESIEMNINEAQLALEAGDIDAYFYVGGAPVNSLSKLKKNSKIQLVNIKAEGMENIYSSKEIPAGTYAWQKKTVITLAVPTILVCNVKEMSIDTRRKLNTLLTDTKSGLMGFQKEGHPKWKDVYTKSHSINWPYYYLKPIVE